MNNMKQYNSIWTPRELFYPQPHMEAILMDVGSDNAMATATALARQQATAAAADQAKKDNEKQAYQDAFNYIGNDGSSGATSTLIVVFIIVLMGFGGFWGYKKYKGE